MNQQPKLPAAVEVLVRAVETACDDSLPDGGCGSCYLCDSHRRMIAAAISALRKESGEPVAWLCHRIGAPDKVRQIHETKRSLEYCLNRWTSQQHTPLVAFLADAPATAIAECERLRAENDKLRRRRRPRFYAGPIGGQQ